MNVTISWLDFRLALRMLVKHPVLTLAAVLANAVAIGIGVIYFDIAHGIANPSLPFEDGDRVVTVENYDFDAGSPERRSLRDFAIWRDGLQSVQSLGVLSRYGTNLVTQSGYVEPVTAVRISAAAFAVPRIPPIAGRALIEADEREGAPPVVVLGEGIWTSVFRRDPAVLGQSVTLAGVSHTVIGIMPGTFAIPVSHQIWVPFRMDPIAYERGEGPVIETIGRLASGVAVEQAQAELTVLGQRIAATFPAPTDERVRPRVVPYLEAYGVGTAVGRWMMALNIVFIMLVMVICANVGALVFARMATRQGELAVRTALGASRNRIIMQFFVESLVLTAAGAVLALAAARWSLQRGMGMLMSLEEEGIPFWWRTDLDPTTILYVALLTLIGAVIIGVLPAIRVTKGGIFANLQRRSAGGSDRRSRRMAAGVVVTQVALSGALLPIAIWGARLVDRFQSVDLDIRTDQYIVAEFGISVPAGTSSEDRAARLDSAYNSLKDRLLADEEVSLTFTDVLPGRTAVSRQIEVADAQGGEPQRRTVQVGSVGLDFFATLDVPILAGRGFGTGDVHLAVRPLVVNEPFVQNVLGGRNAIGQQVRFVDRAAEDPGPWHEIVGVVPDLGMNPFAPDRAEGLYRPVAPSETSFSFLVLHSRGDPAALQNLRSTGTSVDEGLRIHSVYRWNDIQRTESRIYRGVAFGLGIAVSFIIFLSAVVTYALMSLAVSRRTREIGVRVALGSSRRSVVGAVFSRGFLELGAGASLGALVSIAGLHVLEVQLGLANTATTFGVDPVLVIAAFSLICMVGLLSCGLPVARALAIQPTVAMKEEA